MTLTTTPHTGGVRRAAVVGGGWSGIAATWRLRALGVPTLDGLGPEGEGAHAAHEHVDTESFPRRAALVAGLLAS